jgi:hypothetical protein
MALDQLLKQESQGSMPGHNCRAGNNCRACLAEAACQQGPRELTHSITIRVVSSESFPRIDPRVNTGSREEKRVETKGRKSGSDHQNREKI